MLSPAIIVTVSLVLVAAIGYVVGLFRGRRLSAKERAEGDRRRRAETELETAQSTQRRQRERLEQVTAERASMAAERDALREEVELARANAASEHAGQLTESDSLRTLIEAAREEALRAARQLELRDDQLHHARLQLETAGAALADSSRADELRTDDAVSQLEGHVQERDARIESLRGDLRELEESYARQVHERDAELANLRRSVDEHSGETEGLRTGLSQARVQLEERRGELGAMRSATNEAYAERQHLERELADVRDELDRSRLSLADTRRETEELERGYSAQIEQRAAHVDELQAARQRAEERCTALQGQVQERGAKLEEALAARGEIERQAGERERLSETLHGELNEALQHTESERVATNAILAEVTAVGERTQADLESTQLALEEAADRLRRKETAFIRLQRQHTELGEETERKLTERTLEVDHLTRTVSSRTTDLEHARTAAQTAATRGEAIEQALEAERARVHTVQTAMAAQESTLQETQVELNRQVVALEASRSEFVDAENRGERRLRERTLEAERVTTLLRSREEELEQTARLANVLREQVAHEETRCDTRDQRITVLEQEQQRLFDVRERLLREVHEREQEIRQLRALVHVAPEDHDDLEAIDGIGPSIAALLHSLGVHSFRQIAAWDPRTVGWLTDREPQLRGRIRSDWIEAAREAHAAKYGQPPD